MATFDHTLVIGGTGMLAKASRYLSDLSSRLTLVSRDGTTARTRLNLPRTDYISADWTAAETFVARLKPAIDLNPPDLIVLWVHRSGQQARQALLDSVRGSNCRVVDVHGSGTGNVLDRVAHRRLDVTQAGCRYTAVVLGAVKEADGSSRWLSHDEISTAVIRAIETDTDYLVGEI